MQSNSKKTSGCRTDKLEQLYAEVSLSADKIHQAADQQLSISRQEAKVFISLLNELLDAQDNNGISQKDSSISGISSTSSYRLAYEAMDVSTTKTTSTSMNSVKTSPSLKRSESLVVENTEHIHRFIMLNGNQVTACPCCNGKISKNTCKATLLKDSDRRQSVVKDISVLFCQRCGLYYLNPEYNKHIKKENNSYRPEQFMPKKADYSNLDSLLALERRPLISVAEQPIRQASKVFSSGSSQPVSTDEGEKQVVKAAIAQIIYIGRNETGCCPYCKIMLTKVVCQILLYPSNFRYAVKVPESLYHCKDCEMFYANYEIYNRILHQYNNTTPYFVPIDTKGNSNISILQRLQYVMPDGFTVTQSNIYDSFMDAGSDLFKKKAKVIKKPSRPSRKTTVSELIDKRREYIKNISKPNVEYCPQDSQDSYSRWYDLTSRNSKDNANIK